MEPGIRTRRCEV